MAANTNFDVSLTEQAYRQIRSLILYQELRPGDRTSVADLAATIGLGRSPVKSAVERLVSEGLLHVRGRSGTFVPKLSRQDILELFEVRRAYEESAASLIAKRITEEQARSISDLLDKLSETVPLRSGVGSLDRRVDFIDTDVEFHRRIIMGTNNKYFAENYDRLQLHLLISHYLVLDGGAHAAQRHLEHVRIVEAIASRDRDAIAESLTTHVDGIERDTMAIIDRVESRRMNL